MISLYDFYRPTRAVRQYRVFWGRSGTPEYREVVIESDGTDVDEAAVLLSRGPLGPGLLATGSEVV